MAFPIAARNRRILPILPIVRGFAMANECAATTNTPWSAENVQHATEAQEALHLWPLDAYNAALLNEVHPRNYTFPTPHVR